ncbi:hypothetical protein HaLaN_29610 [Haematococcus lacustris]|uniref:Uncharacterized protein n=1 Tax=Haematococcus lacustris TaxID=44745 RepID=A0A6A0AEL7_HAELA|nr:hypothetical protein HaLaN_29610 [Haematococcus lacustris]
MYRHNHMSILAVECDKIDRWLTPLKPSAVRLLGRPPPLGVRDFLGEPDTDQLPSPGAGHVSVSFHAMDVQCAAATCDSCKHGCRGLQECPLGALESVPQSFVTCWQ